MITQERLKQLFYYNNETGVFFRKIPHNRWAIGSEVGFSNTDGYIEAGVDKKYYGVHRLVWMYFYGSFPDGEIDHINGNRRDNRIENLRVANKSINAQNKRCARSDSSTGVLGVSWHKMAKKWVAQISKNGKKKHLGSFDDIEEAKSAYINAKRLLHEGCTI